MTLGGGADKAGKSIQILPKAFPFATLALNIRIASIAIHATSTHGKFLKVEDFRIWHPIQNLPHRPDGSTFGAGQGLDSPTSLRGHRWKLMGRTDMAPAVFHKTASHPRSTSAATSALNGVRSMSAIGGLCESHLGNGICWCLRGLRE